MQKKKIYGENTTKCTEAMNRYALTSKSCTFIRSFRGFRRSCKKKISDLVLLRRCPHIRNDMCTWLPHWFVHSFVHLADCGNHAKKKKKSQIWSTMCNGYALTCKYKWPAIHSFIHSFRLRQACKKKKLVGLVDLFGRPSSPFQLFVRMC